MITTFMDNIRRGNSWFSSNKLEDIEFSPPQERAEIRRDLNKLKDLTKKLDDQEEEILDLEDKYYNLFNSLWNPVVIFKKEGQSFILKDLNESAEKMIGVRKNFLGMPAEKALFPYMYENCGLVTALENSYRNNTKEYCLLSRIDHERVLFHFDCFVYKIRNKDLVIVFENKTKEQHQKINMMKKEKVISSIKEVSVKLSQCSIYDCVHDVLEIIGKNMKLDRVYTFKNHIGENGESLTSHQFEWCNESVIPQLNNPDLQNINYDSIPRWKEYLQNNHPICGSVYNMPGNEQEILFEQGIQSICVVPIFVKGHWWGFIGFDMCWYEKEWSYDEESLLFTLSRIISMSLELDK